MSQATAAEPATSQGPLELSRVQMNVVFVTILLGLLLSALDQTIVSTALPHHRRRPGRGRPRELGGHGVHAGRDRIDGAGGEVR